VRPLQNSADIAAPHDMHARPRVLVALFNWLEAHDAYVRSVQYSVGGPATPPHSMMRLRARAYFAINWLRPIRNGTYDACSIAHAWGYASRW
jgi:hypothetical protein